MAHELLSDTDFTQQVNTALKNYNSVLALARSPLSNSPLVVPLLVLDDVSPTADERGHALRLVLQWAVNRLAPEPERYPLNCFRPYDDPTWRDPHWWRYNILRHRYLEPIHPDEYVEGGRSTETLIALTGIPSADTFFDERNRAVREVAQRLRQQLIDGTASEALQQLALEEVYRPLRDQDAERSLLGIAATFDDVFPRTLLLQLAADEHLDHTEAALDYLTTQRFLLLGDGVLNLWLSPVLQRFVYARQPAARLRTRHQLAANYYRDERESLKAARHLQRAQQWEKAATLLLEAAPDLINELQLQELSEGLDRFRPNHVSAATWREVQILQSDLFTKSGRHQDAIAACRRALKAADEAVQQARIYRRMGKLYENHNQLHALGYYQQAIERFTPNEPELLDTLKDRAWLHIFRQEWNKAETDLLSALAQAPAPARRQKADIFDALASLYRYQRVYSRAIQYAQSALALREEIGDLLRVAHSFGNLGLLYNDMGEYGQALAAYREAMLTFQKLGNRQLIATTWLNIGMTYYYDKNVTAAVDAYKESLALCQEIGLPLVEIKAHYNLAEALADLNQAPAARQHWQAGYTLSVQFGFEDELADLKELQQKTPVLQTNEATNKESTRLATSTFSTQLTPEAHAILALMERTGQVTPKLLMEALHVSKATATRRLSEFVRQGLLAQHGKGRGSYYTLTGRNGLTPSTPASPLTSLHSDDKARPLHLEHVMHTLRQQEQMLRDQYELAALGLVNRAPVPTPVPLVDVVVRFVTLPSLLQFFELEKQLATLVGVRVDLRLAESASAAATTPVPVQIVWVWHEGDRKIDDPTDKVNNGQLSIVNDQ